VAQVVEGVSAKAGIPMAKLAIAWPLGRKFVASVIIGVRNQEQLAANLEPGDWDMPADVWKTLEEQTRPEEEYQIWLNKMAYARFFNAADFHDERAELP
jgi:aryl-alcohol dehydrogenase-like predicted oxidoreductase